MKKRLLILIPLVIVPILAGFSIYYKEQVNGFFGTTYASNYLLIGLIVVEALNGIFAYISEAKRHLEDKKENHKELILGILTYMASNGQIQYRSGTIFHYKFNWANELEDYKECLSHLKKYGNTLELLDKARRYSDDLTDKIQKKFEEYDQYLNTKLNSYEEFPTLDRIQDRNTPYWNKAMTRQVVYEMLWNETKKLQAHEMEVKTTGPNQVFTLRWSNQQIATGSEDILNGLKTFINVIKNDNTLKSKIVEIIELDKQLPNNKSLEQFETKREEIVRELTKGQKDLKGDCTLCRHFRFF